MPVVNGQVFRSRFTSLKLGELSSVDNPAQPGALAVIMKRNFSADERQAMADSGEALPDGSFPIKTKADLANAIQALGRAKDQAKAKAHIITRARALGALDSLPEDWNVKKAEAVEAVWKYIGEDDGAHSFTEVLQDSEFCQQIWPYTDALTQSIRSIVGDKSLTGGDREAKISDTVSEFLAAVRTISPATAKILSGLITKGHEMPKSIEELEKQVGELTGQLTSANALLATEKARADAAEKAAADAKSEEDKMKEQCGKLEKQLAEATDETIKVGDQEIKKSEVGAASFTLAKTLANERSTAILEKRAAEEFGHVPGTATEKALVLKLIDGKDVEKDDTAKALTAILTAAEKMIKAGFGRIGTTGGQTETQKAAEQAWTEKVAEVKKSNPNMKEFEALEKARSEFPDEFAAYQEGRDAVAAN